MQSTMRLEYELPIVRLAGRMLLMFGVLLMVAPLPVATTESKLTCGPFGNSPAKSEEGALSAAIRAIQPLCLEGRQFNALARPRGEQALCVSI